MKRKPTETMICDNKTNFLKTILFGFVIVFCFGTFSCSKNENTAPTPIVDEPKYLEWNYEAGKDPLLIQIFTFANGIDSNKSFDISDTNKVENIFNGYLEGYDRFNTNRKLDMTKNSWSNQVFPEIPVKIGGYEFSASVRDELFKDLKLTNAADKNILLWARDNLSNWTEKTSAIFNNKLKPILTQRAENYYQKNRKKPKYQVSVFIIPREYYESGYSGTVVTFSDGNVVVIGVEPTRSTDSSGELERILNIYGLLGHEFAGHQLKSDYNSNSGYVEYVGKKDQFGNEVDGFGHVNSPAPRNVFNGATSNHLRLDDANTTMLFPQANKEFLTGYKEGFESSNINLEEQKKYYGNLKLMKTPSEQSNIPYIANMVSTKKVRGEKFMKEMWTDKILVPKGGRVSTKEEFVTIKSIISCR